MPRASRLDGSGVVHHIMVRGIERRLIFRQRRDYLDLLERLDRVLPESGVSCFAWVLMPNHVHLVVQRGAVPISRVMARVNTGYAVTFNRRHGRCGYLFQNRFLSRPVKTTEDLVQLIRYVHLNPVRAGRIGDLAGLEAFPWSGYAALAGRARPRAFHSVNQALKLFGETPAPAYRQLRKWMEMGLAVEHDAAQKDASSTATLGMDWVPEETARIRSGGAGRPGTGFRTFAELVGWVGKKFGVPLSSLGSSSKRRAILRARAVLCSAASRELGMSGREISAALGIADSSVSRAIARGTEGLGRA